jgi:hypothetical protein
VSAGQSQASITLEPMTSASQARQASRELAALGWTTVTGYGGRWLETPGAAPVSAVAGAASRAAMTAAGVPAGDRDGGAAVENHPSAPITGSGGAGGGSAAGGGSGTASSASSILVGALLQAAPNVMRLLSTSQQSWRTTFFALIPERPG